MTNKESTMKAKKRGWKGFFELVARDRKGRVMWTDKIENALVDEGEQLILDVFLRGAAPPAEFYLRLFNDTPEETDTLADLLGEPVGNGYAPIAVERSSVGWPVLELDLGDWQATSKTVTFTASGGDIGPVTCCVLATADDVFVAFAMLSEQRILRDGESLDVTYKVKLS